MAFIEVMGTTLPLAVGSYRNVPHVSRAVRAAFLVILAISPQNEPLWSFCPAIPEPGRVSRKINATCGLA